MNRDAVNSFSLHIIVDGSALDIMPRSHDNRVVAEVSTSTLKGITFGEPVGRVMMLLSPVLPIRFYVDIGRSTNFFQNSLRYFDQTGRSASGEPFPLVAFYEASGRHILLLTTRRSVTSQLGFLVFSIIILTSIKNYSTPIDPVSTRAIPPRGCKCKKRILWRLLNYQAIDAFDAAMLRSNGDGCWQRARTYIYDAQKTRIVQKILQLPTTWLFGLYQLAVEHFRNASRNGRWRWLRWSISHRRSLWSRRNIVHVRRKSRTVSHRTRTYIISYGRIYTCSRVNALHIIAEVISAYADCSNVRSHVTNADCSHCRGVAGNPFVRKNHSRNDIRTREPKNIIFLVRQVSMGQIVQTPVRNTNTRCEIISFSNSIYSV